MFSIQTTQKLIAGICTAGALTLTLGACGSATPSQSSTATESKTIVVGASPSPHAEILEQVKPLLEKKGYKLEIREFTDYIQPNVTLDQGELDANYFQHGPYLDDYNEKNNTKLKNVAGIHFEPMTIFAGKSSDLKNVPDQAKVAVPSDATNEARALLLLEAQGLIKLKANAGLQATVQDIVENPHNLEIVEIEAATVTRILPDVDYAVVNGNYALSAGLKADTALAHEDAKSEAAKTYANIIAVADGKESSEKTKALVEALTSPEIKDFITKKYNNTVIAVF